MDGGPFFHFVDDGGAFSWPASVARGVFGLTYIMHGGFCPTSLCCDIFGVLLIGCSTLWLFFPDCALAPSLRLRRRAFSPIALLLGIRV